MSRQKEVRPQLLERLIGWTWLEHARLETQAKSGFLHVEAQHGKGLILSGLRLDGHCRPTASFFRSN